MNKFIVILAIILFSMCHSLIADEELLTPSDPEASFITESPEEKDKIFKWAWELPSYGDTYPVAKRYIWSEPNSGGEIYAVLGRTRNEEKADAYSAFVYGAFRPFALDFKTWSVVFGASYIGGSEKFEEPSNTQDQDVFNGELVDIFAQTADGETSQQTINFSAVASFPAVGLQLFLDFGYAWTYINIDIDQLNFTGEIDFGGVKLPFILTYDEYAYKQRDEGIYLAFEARQFFDRTYLNFFSLLFYGVFNHGTVRRSSRATVTLNLAGEVENFGRVDLPSGVAEDPQGKDFDTTVLGFNLTSRLISFPMTFWIVDNQSLSLDGIFSTEYSAGELFGDDFHGAAISLGAQISFFDVMSLSYTYTWNTRNDLLDEWDLVLTVGIYGGLGETTPNIRQISRQ